ncbi:uncharacterized protein [Paramormyrops kingsleyae]|uniref:uncharacterized protein isoform X2 n=1 Tax=Paramormyrops kingsleyae TaxID=1676925 RepID=UPI003B97B0BF
MNHQQTIEMNHYESDPPSQDIYETLHSKPAETRYRYVEVQRSPHRKKLVFILLAANTLLLVTILAIVVVHYRHVSQPPPFAPSNEEWYLHDDTFYLFWSGQGSCEEAKGFCIQRGAQLLTVDSNNEAWVKSVVRGRQVFVEGSPSAGSGISDYEVRGQNWGHRKRDMQPDRHSGRETRRQTDIQGERHAARQTFRERETRRQTDIQGERDTQADRHSGRERHAARQTFRERETRSQTDIQGERHAGRWSHS